MAIEAAAVSVTTTATALNTGEGDRLDLLLHNNGASTVYLGPSGVTTANGLPLAAGEKLAVNGLFGDGVLYGRTASGTVEVRVLRSGVGVG